MSTLSSSEGNDIVRGYWLVNLVMYVNIYISIRISIYIYLYIYTNIDIYIYIYTSIYIVLYNKYNLQNHDLGPYYFL